MSYVNGDGLGHFPNTLKNDIKLAFRVVEVSFTAILPSLCVIELITAGLFAGKLPAFNGGVVGKAVSAFMVSGREI